jgi:hypothetical protein
MPSTRQAARVVFLDRDTLPADVELRRFDFPHELVEFGATSPADVGERIAAAESLSPTKYRFAGRRSRRRRTCVSSPSQRPAATMSTFGRVRSAASRFRTSGTTPSIRFPNTRSPRFPLCAAVCLRPARRFAPGGGRMPDGSAISATPSVILPAPRWALSETAHWADRWRKLVAAARLGQAGTALAQPKNTRSMNQ